MITTQLILDLANELKTSNGFTSQQVLSAAVLGSLVGQIKPYKSSMVYKKGDKIPLVTDDGELLIAICIGDNVTGSFNPNYWEEWNLLNETQGLYNDYIILSWNKPNLRRNKVWLEIMDESLEDASKIFGEDAGLLIYNNLVISERQPTMNTSTVWGRIDEVLG